VVAAKEEGESAVVVCSFGQSTCAAFSQDRLDAEAVYDINRHTA
jgi:hypothetical protein